MIVEVLDVPYYKLMVDTVVLHVQSTDTPGQYVGPSYVEFWGRRQMTGDVKFDLDRAIHKAMAGSVIAGAALVEVDESTVDNVRNLICVAANTNPGVSFRKGIACADASKIEELVFAYPTDVKPDLVAMVADMREVIYVRSASALNNVKRVYVAVPNTGLAGW
ncbi:MAG: hypothetical protein WBP12_04370, partial [Candidatus Saccharimonas sp.]